MAALSGYQEDECSISGQALTLNTTMDQSARSAMDRSGANNSKLLNMLNASSSGSEGPPVFTAAAQSPGGFSQLQPSAMTFANRIEARYSLSADTATSLHVSNFLSRLPASGVDEAKHSVWLRSSAARKKADSGSSAVPATRLARNMHHNGDTSFATVAGVVQPQSQTVAAAPESPAAARMQAFEYEYDIAGPVEFGSGEGSEANGIIAGRRSKWADSPDLTVRGVGLGPPPVHSQSEAQGPIAWDSGSVDLSVSGSTRTLPVPDYSVLGGTAGPGGLAQRPPFIPAGRASPRRQQTRMGSEGVSPTRLHVPPPQVPSQGLGLSPARLRVQARLSHMSPPSPLSTHNRTVSSPVRAARKVEYGMSSPLGKAAGQRIVSSPGSPSGTNSLSQHVGKTPTLARLATASSPVAKKLITSPYLSSPGKRSVKRTSPLAPDAPVPIMSVSHDWAELAAAGSAAAAAIRGDKSAGVWQDDGASVTMSSVPHVARQFLDDLHDMHSTFSGDVDLDALYASEYGRTFSPHTGRGGAVDDAVSPAVLTAAPPRAPAFSTLGARTPSTPAAVLGAGAGRVHVHPLGASAGYGTGISTPATPGFDSMDIRTPTISPIKAFKGGLHGRPTLGPAQRTKVADVQVETRGYGGGLDTPPMARLGAASMPNRYLAAGEGKIGVTRKPLGQMVSNMNSATQRRF